MNSSYTDAVLYVYAKPPEVNLVYILTKIMEIKLYLSVCFFIYENFLKAI